MVPSSPPAGRRFVEYFLLASLAGIGLLAIIANLVDGGSVTNAGTSTVMGPRVQKLREVGTSTINRGIDPVEVLTALTMGIRVAALPRGIPSAESDAPDLWAQFENLGVFAGSRPGDVVKKATFLSPASCLRVAIYARTGRQGGALAVAVELSPADPPIVKGFLRSHLCFVGLLDLDATGGVVGGTLRVLLPPDGGAVEPPDEHGSYCHGDEFLWDSNRHEATRWIWRPKPAADTSSEPVILRDSERRDLVAPSRASLDGLVAAAWGAVGATTH